MGAEVESNLACTYNHVGLPQNISSVGAMSPPHPHWGQRLSQTPSFSLQPASSTSFDRQPLSSDASWPRRVTAGEQAGFEFPLSLPAHLLPIIKNSVEKSGFCFSPE